ncbi:MAG: hypothetical protein GAK43_02672 [Stenotrophomonas maltophilia]|nr:MAG: hypothetical protein GAK43_02672 [Stenotrophomonas maltophilia]
MSDTSSASAPHTVIRDQDQQVSSEHRVTLDGQTITYQATAGHMVFDDRHGEPGASLFYVAYTVPSQDGRPRPLSFFFNGGPGSPTTFLLLASVAPVRLETAESAPTPAAPYSVVENPHSLLDRSDLVFIDAPGTGFSQLLSESAKRDFWGTDEDVRAFADFIKRYVSRNDRWNSPKYIVGESYGTMRGAALARVLQDQDIAINGLVLVSSILNFGERIARTYQHYIGLLPSYALTARYHGKANGQRELEALALEARDFARGDFAYALASGHSLTDAERQRIAQRTAEFIGLPADYIAAAHFRIEPDRYCKALLREQGSILGFYDARFLGADLDAVGETAGYRVDSVFTGSAFHSVANDYIRRVLGYRPDQERLHRGRIDPHKNDWDWSHSLPDSAVNHWRRLPYANSIADLAHVLVRNPNLKVLVANGYYDLCTPYFQAEFDIDHLLLPAALRQNVAFRYYGAGHMMYLNLPSLVALKADLARFFDLPASELASLDARPQP